MLYDLLQYAVGICIFIFKIALVICQYRNYTVIINLYYLYYCVGTYLNFKLFSKLVHADMR
jgi:hypothetical protein